MSGPSAHPGQPGSAVAGGRQPGKGAAVGAAVRMARPFSAPRFYFQCEGREPTVLLIKTTQKEVRTSQRDPGSWLLGRVGVRW